MSRRISLLGSLLIGALFFLSAAATAQEECVSIENDISRLQCFDEAFSGIAPERLSPTDAFARLSKLIESEYGRWHVGAAFHEDSCALMLFSRYNAPQGSWNRDSLRMVVFGAGDVEIETLEFDGGSGMTLYGDMSRGAGAHVIELVEGMADEHNLAAGLAMFSFGGGAQALLGFGRLMGSEPQFTRSFYVRAATEESQVDRGRIVNALKDVVKACQS